jgi:hypothetical protein
MSPRKKSPAENEAVMYQEVAAEIAVTVDYRTLRASSEKLIKSEESSISTAKHDAYIKAISLGVAKPAALIMGEFAAKRLTFKFKLARAWNREQKVVALAVSDFDTVIKDRVNRTDYLAEISTAYTRILAHRVFKNILTTPPNPIQNEEGGECGMQAVFDNEQCTTALMRENIYRAGCNFFWLNLHRSVMPGVPLSIHRIREVVDKYWQSPKSFNGIVTVEAQADQVLPRMHNLLILSPEELSHIYLLAIDLSISRGDSDEILLQWRKYCLSVCFEYRDFSGQGPDAAYWWSWNNREQVCVTADAVKRTAYQRACEIFSYKTSLEQQQLPCTAEAIAHAYTGSAIYKKDIGVPFIRECLTVFDKVCSNHDITMVIKTLEIKFGTESCLNSLGKLQKIVEKCETVQHRVIVFQAIDDAIDRGLHPNNKFTREFLTGSYKNAGSMIPFVTFVIFRWRCRDHLISIQLPQAHMDHNDIFVIAEKTASYSTYRRELDDSSGADTSWIGKLNPSSVLALRLIQEQCVALMHFYVNISVSLRVGSPQTGPRLRMQHH